MEQPPRREGHNSWYAEWVDGAAQAHLEALQNFGMRGWNSRTGFVVLTEDEASECSSRAFDRLLKELQKEDPHPTVVNLILDYEPKSQNAYRMLRRLIIFSAYDMFRENGRYVTEGGLGEDDGLEADAESAASVMESLIQDYQERHPQRDPREAFEESEDLGRIVAAAIRQGLLNETRQFILLAHLASREESDIAAELGLETQQVQRHMYKIKEALRKAKRGLEGDN